MTLASSSSSSADGSNGTSPAAPPQSTAQTKTQPDNDSSSSVTPLQLGLAAVILGASAGLTLYTKKSAHMLNQLERASKNVTQRKGPPKFGPKNKMEWEKTRSRWEKDDL